ncbi:hypothetical protein QUF76_10325 [Desulfobacterales bacterium HSG16]|nr:hypothetical protein [Desulfobacterales bacterium HSG16]
MPSIVHFEIPTDDIERARKFYTELFAWEIEKYEGPGEYWMIKTGGEKPVEGGMMQRQHPDQPITNYVDVSSVDEYSKKIKELDGKILVPKTPVPAVGFFALCQDTENNIFGLWEADPTASLFANEAEVFVAVLASVIAADANYSVDEMRTVWYEVEELPLFEGHDFKKLESKVFKMFNRKPSEPTSFSIDEISTIIMSAKNMLSPENRNNVFRSAVRLAHAEKNIEGYKLEIDEREQAIIDRLRKELEISDETVQDAIKSLSPEY